MSIEGLFTAAGLVLVALGVVVSVRGASARTVSTHRLAGDDAAQPRADNQGRLSSVFIVAGVVMLVVAGVIVLARWIPFASDL